MATKTKITVNDVINHQAKIENGVESKTSFSCRIKGATVISDCKTPEEFVEKWNSGKYRTQLNKSGNSYSLLLDGGDFDVDFWKEQTTVKKTIAEQLGLVSEATLKALANW
jgi:hypothetical protein